MSTRFQGGTGSRKVRDALRAAECVNHDPGVLQALLAIGEVVEYAEGQDIVAQGGEDDDVYVILMGSVDILIDGRRADTRVGGELVGEMEAIDPTLKRVARIRAREATTLMRFPGDGFVSVADENPVLWRNIVVDFSGRLRIRTRRSRPPNARPLVFIGSSRQNLPVARAIQLQLDHDDMDVIPWTDDEFLPNVAEIETLLKHAAASDFGVFILGADDLIAPEGKVAVPRDNVLLEAGMFLGAMGRDRVLMVAPRNLPVKIPSDLLGTRLLTYEARAGGPAPHDLGPVCERIRRVVATQSVR